MFVTSGALGGNGSQGVWLTNVAAIASGTATYLCFESNLAQNVVLVIYSTANALLGYTNPRLIAASSGIVKIPLISPVSITSGTYYQLGVMSTTGFPSYYTDGNTSFSTSGMIGASFTYPTPPSTFVSNDSNGVGVLSVWAETSAPAMKMYQNNTTQIASVAEYSGLGLANGPSKLYANGLFICNNFSEF